ncbi:DUF3899 domain-containing protein [Sporolactobacillus kofuensis]|uniref:DUF3899 domain-containing protein n=1 Tax=Sporolactobacillus kofuensis TaxID=269672 RepID=A0ABW1WAV6_9BACL|nr:DUF3899 domain-containing protein [Sporolactobacillus kofuensis]MCO7174506.1 DUF3899 domain-containing protein [Sporolactobacillus kofuensis]
MKVFLTNFRISFLYIGLVEVVLVMISQFLYHDPFSMLSLIDAVSMVSLFFFSIGLIMFIYQGGAFDGILYSFKRFARATRNKRLGEHDVEAPLAEFKHRDGKRSFVVWSLIFDSLVLFIFSLIFSFFLYH